MLLVLGDEAVPVNISNSVIHDLIIGDYVACTHQCDWYAGIILDVSIDIGDVCLKFMYPKVCPCFLNGLQSKVNAGLL